MPGLAIWLVIWFWRAVSTYAAVEAIWPKRPGPWEAVCGGLAAEAPPFVFAFVGGWAAVAAPRCWGGATVERCGAGAGVGREGALRAGVAAPRR